MFRSRYRIDENQAPDFLTCTVVNWLPPFSSPPVVDILYASWRFLQAREPTCARNDAGLPGLLEVVQAW
jgi:hypothetical protein